MSNYTEENINQTIDWGNVFVRTGQFPLDRSSIFGSYLDAEKYAKGDGSDERGLGLTSYVGQIITVFENDIVTIYKINADRTLEELVSSSKAIEIENWVSGLSQSYDELVVTVQKNYDDLLSEDNKINERINDEVQQLNENDANIESRLIVSGDYSCENGELKLNTNDNEKSLVIDLNSGYGKVETITKNRLQLVHCDTLFATAQEAYDYINSDLNKIIKPSLFAEPMVLKYGDEKNPNIILGIGAIGDGKTQSLNNKVYFIDFNKVNVLEQNLNAYIQEYENTKEHITSSLLTLSQNIAALSEKDNEINDKIEGEILRAKKAEEDLEKKLTLSTNDSKSIALSTENGTLEANVKVQEYKNENGKILTNIITIEENGLFAYCDVNYDDNVLSVNVNGQVKNFDLPQEVYIVKSEFDKETQKIIFTYNDNTTFNLDVNNIVSLSSDEHNIITKTNGELFAKAELSYDTGTNTLTFDNGKTNKEIKIIASNSFINNDSNNILQFKGDGLYANVTLEYQKARNVLVFDNGLGDAKIIELTDHTIIKNGYYDNTKQAIVLVVSGIDANGMVIEKEITIPAQDLVQDLKVNNREQVQSPVKIFVNYNSDEKTNEIYATINILNEQNSPLKQDGDIIYIDNQASAYQASYKNSTVSVQDALTDIANRLNDNDNYLNDNTKNIQNITENISSIEEQIATSKNDINTLNQEVKDLDIAVVNSKNEAISTSNNYTDGKVELLNKDIQAAKTESKGYTDDEVEKVQNTINSSVDNIEKELAELVSITQLNAQSISTEALAREAIDNSLNEKITTLNNKIGSVDENKTIVELINEAQKSAIAAATRIEEQNDGYIIVSSVEDENGTFTYTISSNDIASASAVSVSIESLTNDIVTTKTEAIETASAYTDGKVSAATEALQGAIDIAKSEAIETATTYTDSKVIELTNAIASAQTEAITNANTYANEQVLAATEALQGAIDEVSGALKTYTIQKVTTGLAANVEERYQLMENGVQVGDVIDIKKDSSLKEVSLVSEKPSDIEGEEPIKGQFLKFTYLLSEGGESNVYIDLSLLTTKTEFGLGLEVSEAGVVSIKRDDTSEAFLSVGENGVKVSGVADAIALAKTEAITSATTYTDVQVSAAIEALQGEIASAKTDAIETASAYTDAQLSAATEALTSVITSNTNAIDTINNKLNNITNDYGYFDQKSE